MKPITDKQQPHWKKMVKIQVQYLLPIRKESYRNIPKYWHRQCDRISKKFSHTIKVDVEDISNKERLAYVLRKHFGFYEMNVLFYNRLCKSSNYNPRFVCLLQRNKPCKYEMDCSVKKRHKKGWSCKMNRKIRPNWSKRARIKIHPKHTFSEMDYGYVWDKRSDKMHYFGKWFWMETR